MIVKRPYQIIIDTNILIAGLRSDQGAAFKLISILNFPQWQINLSIALALEYEEVLKRQSAKLNISVHDIDVIIDAICAIAKKHKIYYLRRPSSTDPDDDFIIDLAAAAQVDFIVTYNAKHLQSAKLYGVRLLTPAEFLRITGVFK